MLPILLLQLAAAQHATATPDPAFHQPPGLQLTYVRFLTWAPGARLLLSDEPGAVIQLLDSTGALLPPLARTGSGPGEARRAAMTGWHHDSLWVEDIGLRRVSVFSADLHFAYSRRDTERCGDPPWGIAPDGRCITLPQRFVTPDQPLPTALPLLLTRPGGATDTLGIMRLPRMVFRYANGESHLNQPLADDPVPVISRDGRFFAWVHRRPADPDQSPAVLVEYRDLGSGTRREFLVPYTPQPVPADSIRRILQTFTDIPGGTPVRGYADSIARKLYRPKDLPAFAQALFDGQGRLWLKDQPAGSAPTARWRVFDASGHAVLSLELPRRVTVQDIAPDRIAGVLLDEDDVPQVVVWRYRAPGQ